MDWPSERVQQGGLFHLPKVKYSPETQDLIKVLMEESRLTMMNRKKIDYFLRNGEPLPLPVEKNPVDENEIKRLKELAAKRMSRVARRKTQDTIRASGAYECPRYQPKPDGKDTIEKAKIKLQETMSGIKICSASSDGSSSSNIRSRKSKGNPEWKFDPYQRMDELLTEITERSEWLEEMEKLGEGKKHREIIRLQISDKLTEFKQIEKQLKNRQNSTTTTSSE